MKKEELEALERRLSVLAVLYDDSNSSEFREGFLRAQAACGHAGMTMHVRHVVTPDLRQGVTLLSARPLTAEEAAEWAAAWDKVPPDEA